MRSACGLALVLALLGTAPAFAQQPPPPPPPNDGLVIVGHGPDVPNVSGDIPNVSADAAAPVDLAPVPLVVVVPVPVFVGRPHHHGPRPAAAPTETPANPFGRFLTDPSRRFLNPIVPPGPPNS